MSIQNQSYENFEVIVVDAGSTDGTASIISNFGANYKFYMLEGSTQGEARNFGVEKSKGECINFLDSDEFYLPNCLEYHYKFFSDNPDFAAHYCDVLHYRTLNKKSFGIKKIQYQPKELKDFIAGYSHNLTGMSVRRICIDNGIQFESGENGRVGEEGWFQYRIAADKFKFHYDREPVGFCEMRTDSHTQWGIQHKIKTKRLNDRYRMGVEIGRSLTHYELDAIRIKLIISLLIVDDFKKISELINQIKSYKIKLPISNLILLIKLLPKKLRINCIIKMWIMYQNYSFDWRALSSEEATYFGYIEST